MRIWWTQNFKTKVKREDRKRESKWARTSDEVKTVQKMEKHFLATVKQSKVLALQKKEELKKKKRDQTMNILAKCKVHGGPVTVADLDDLLDKLDNKQLLLEFAYLRATVAPDIRQKRRVKILDGKFKFENLSKEELKTLIRNAVYPENELRDDVDALLKSVFAWFVKSMNCSTVSVINFIHKVGISLSAWFVPTSV